MIASLDGIVAAIAFDSLIVEVGGVGYRVFASPSVLASAAPGSRLKLFTHHVVREDLQALYGFRTVEELGFFGLLLTVTGVGPEGRDGDRGLAPDRRAPARDHAAGPGGARLDPGDRQAARRAGDLRAQGEGRGGGRRGVGVAVLGRPRGEGDVVGALQALGYSLPEAREAAGIGARHGRRGASLEDRVKAALRVLARD